MNDILSSQPPNQSLSSEMASRQDIPMPTTENGTADQNTTMTNQASNNESYIDEICPSPKSQSLLIPPDLRQQRPSASDVIVLAFGSYGIRYGFASDTTPKRILPAVAFPRSQQSIDDPTQAPIRVPRCTQRTDEEISHANDVFKAWKESVSKELALHDRRRGGGRPIPWKAVIETVSVPSQLPNTDKKQSTDNIPNGNTPRVPLIGRDVQLLLLDEEKARNYDIVHPIWDGKLLFDCGAPASLIRKALEVLFDYIVMQLTNDLEGGKNKKKKLSNQSSEPNGKKKTQAETQTKSNMFTKDGVAKSFITLVVPESSQRRDVAEIVGAVFNSNSLRAAAVFIHQSAVSCALGAGLATCAVVDIGHSATTVACVDDGIVLGESRIHLEYGSSHIKNALHMLLKDCSNLKDYEKNESNPQTNTPQFGLDDETALLSKAMETMSSFNVDENDTLNNSVLKLPTGLSLRVKLGVGIRALPAYGLIHPPLLEAATIVMTPHMNIAGRSLHQKNSEDDNYVSDIFNDLRRSGIATAALRIGLFANDRGQLAADTVYPKVASISDAVMWAIARAVEIRRPDPQSRTTDHYKKFLNAVVLAGGGASIDGIALVLEGRIKKGFVDAGLNITDVTVIDGGKGKGDEELAAAAAVLKDVDSESGIIDDTDTASLPWKGGAVMVEANAVSDYWIYRDDWYARDVRALREKAPFYW